MGGQLIRLHVREPSTDLVHQGQAHGVLRRDEVDQPLPGFWAGIERLSEERLQQEDLDPALAHPLHELVVLVLRTLDPEHVVEQQVVVVGGRQPLEAEPGSVDHHLSQATNL